MDVQDIPAIARSTSPVLFQPQADGLRLPLRQRESNCTRLERLEVRRLSPLAVDQR